MWARFPEVCLQIPRVAAKLGQARSSRNKQVLRGRCLPIFRFNKAFVIVRDVKKFLNRKRIKSKKRELSQIDREHRELRDAKVPAEVIEPKEIIEHKRRKKRAQQEIFQLARELGAAKDRVGGMPDGGQPASQVVGGSETGALPDFVIIGGKKCGTTFLYNLLIRHPHVEPAASKGMHFFDMLFDEGIEWYRRCFPTPSWKGGRRTITGEASPYLADPLAPERMAQVVPQARLIALLRDPVDRAYSDYQHAVRLGRENRTFEEAVEEAIQAGVTWPLCKEDDASERDEARLGPNGTTRYQYLLRSIYVDQLLHWSKFFIKKQMFVLKSEDFFERPPETTKVILDFLGLPDWEPGAWELPKKLNKGEYEQEMDPALKRRLEDYLEPHNRRLYEYLDMDLGW